MKVYLSIDIEGITGICDWSETEHGGINYEYYRKQMTNEAIACIKALQEYGVKDIYVRDAHDTARNINIADLPSGIHIIRGWAEEPCDMLACLDETFDACFFIGYHSPSRSSANPLSHTLNLRHNHIKINQQIMSEFHLNAYFAQGLGVPVVFVSGDEGLCELVKLENKNIKTVSTKKGLSNAVISRHFKDVLEDIKNETIQAMKELKDASKNHFDIAFPDTFEVEIHFKNHAQAHRASFYPGAIRLDTDKIVYKSQNYSDILTFIFFVDK